MYTSGCPKNQNKCWYKIGSPPPAGSKNVVLKFRSVRSIVMAPARTGSAKRSRIVVIKMDHRNRGIRSKVIIVGRMFKIVVIKLMAPRIDEIPARCSEKIVKSTDVLLWNAYLDKGG